MEYENIELNVTIRLFGNATDQERIRKALEAFGFEHDAQVLLNGKSLHGGQD